jgi:hypothetical protein
MILARLLGNASRISFILISPVTECISPLLTLVLISLMLSRRGGLRLGWQVLQSLLSAMYGVFILGLRRTALLCAMLSLRLNSLLGFVCLHEVQVFVLG